MSPVLTAVDPEWIDPDITPAPRGKTLQILTIEGVTIRGEWAEDMGYVGYAPLLKIPPAIKSKMGIYELKQHYANQQARREKHWRQR